MRRARRTSGYVWASLVSVAVIAIAASRSNSGEVPGKTSKAQSKPNSAASPKRKSPISLPSGIRQVSTQDDDLREVRPEANRSADPARLAGLFAQDTNSPALLPPPAPGNPGPLDAVPSPNPPRATSARGPLPIVEVGSGERLKLVEFRGLPLADAMQAFAEQAGVNVVTSPDAAKVEISVYLRNVTAKQALDAITKANNLFYKVDEQSGIVRVLTTKEYKQTLADFQDERTEVFTLLYPNPYVVALAIRNTFGNRVQLGFGDQMSDQDQMTDLTQRLQRFNLIDSQNQGLGLSQGGQNGQNGGNRNGSGGGFGGGGFGNQFGGGGFGNQFGGGLGNQFGGGLGGGFGGIGGGLQGNQQGANNDRKQLENLTPEDIFAIEQARQNNAADPRLSGLLERSQASIYVSVIRRNNQLIVRTGDEQVMQQIRDLVARLDVPTPLVLLEVKVMRVDLLDGFHSVFDYQLTDGSHNAGTFSQGDFVGIPGKTADNIAVAGSTFLNGITLPGGISAGAKASDLTFQYVNQSFRMRMQLLEDRNRVTVLSSPLLLTANNEVSRIFVGETVPITTTSGSTTQLQNVGNTNTNLNAPTTELQDIGQALLIAPNINADRTVTLRISQEQSDIKPNGGTIYLPVTSGVANQTTGFQAQQVDTVRRRTISGTVVAKDCMSVAIGGLIEEGVADVRSGVPVLGKLPGLGFFFRRQATGRARTEYIVMIRPYVFNTPAESAALSQQLLPELSIHPKAMDPSGVMNTFLPHEVVRPNPPLDACDNIFRFHSVEPKSY